MADDFRYTLTIGEQRHELPDGETTVGRSRSSGLRIDDDSVSRNHAVLHCGNGVVLLRDLGSSNGTFHGDERVIGELPVPTGALLRFGTVLARIEIESNRPSNELTLPLGNPCGACGARNPEGQKRCFNCGSSLTEPSPPEEAAPSPPVPQEEMPPERPTVRSGPIELPLRSGPVETVAPAAPRSPAAPGKRLAAAFVDALVVFAIDLLFLLPALLLALIHRSIGEMGGAGPDRLFRGIFWSLVGGAVLVTAGYFVSGWCGAGRTFGQKRYRLRVEGPDGASPIGLGRALLRFLAAVVSVGVLGLGFLPIFSSARRALHDLVAGTRVTGP